MNLFSFSSVQLSVKSDLCFTNFVMGGNRLYIFISHISPLDTIFFIISSPPYSLGLRKDARIWRSDSRRDGATL